MKNINLADITKTISNLNRSKKTNNTWRTVGLIALGAAALYYPAMRLYKYAKQRRQNAIDENASMEDGQLKSKVFSPSYRGNHKPHHRKAQSNGHLQTVSDSKQ